MDQIFSIILAIAMLFSSMGGMTASLEEPVSFDAKITMDPATLLAMSDAGTETAATEESEQIIKVIGDVLDAITLRGVATKEAAELQLLAGESVALSIGAKNEEAGVTVASSLLGNNVVFASAEQLAQMQQAGTGVQPGASAAAMEVDKEQLAKDLAEAGKKLTQAIEAKKGETEAGEFTVDGMTFTGKTPVNMSYKEFAAVVLTAARELAAKESVKPLFAATGKDVDAELAKMIETVTNTPEEELPQLDLAIYTDADNCAYYATDILKPAKTEDKAEGGEDGGLFGDIVKQAKAADAADDKLHVGFGTVDGMKRIKATADSSSMKMDIVYAGTEENVFELKATIASQGMTVEIDETRNEAGALDATFVFAGTGMNGKLIVHTEPAEDGRTAFDMKLFLSNDGQPMLAITGSAGKGGEIVSTFEGEKIKVIPIETLTSTTDKSTGSTLQVQLIAGLLKAVTVVTKNVPEDTAAWINAQISQMMNPKPAATEVPQEEPAAVGE